MKTRIIWTKIYLNDDWFNSLPVDQKFLFIYLFTNSHIGLTGIYQLSERLILLETGLTKEQLDQAKEVFERDKKVFFYQSWVYVANANKNNQYHKGEKTKIAYFKELQLIPKEIIDYFNSRYTVDTLSIHYPYTIYTTINHKSETINHKSEKIKHIKKINKNKINKEIPTSKNSLTPCNEEELKEISSSLNVSLDAVIRTHEIIKNKIAAKEFKNKTVYYSLKNWIIMGIERGTIKRNPTSNYKLIKTV